jgi:DNA-binding MarR family transcriptional regulator
VVTEAKTEAARMSRQSAAHLARRTQGEAARRAVLEALAAALAAGIAPSSDELAAMVGRDGSTVRRILARLVKDGHVTHRPGARRDWRPSGKERIKDESS